MSDANTNETTGTPDDSPRPSKMPWGCIGCASLLLLFFFGPVLMMAFSDYIHVAGLALAGLTAWFLLARLFGHKISDRGAILPGMLLLAALVVLGLSMPVVGILPCPSWCARNVVKRADYRAMELIFNQPLPPSFHITQLHYPGYNLIFNGPDGPLSAEYEATLEKRDYAALMARASKKEIPSKDGEWSAFGYQCKSLLERFGNDWPAKYDRERWKGGNVTPPKVYRVESQVRDTTASALVTVDDRASSTVRLYLYTRVPYWMN